MLNERDQNILTYISNYISKHGYPPSYEEIGEANGLKSKSSVHERMQKLLRLGYLETDHSGCPRAYRIANKEL